MNATQIANWNAFRLLRLIHAVLPDSLQWRCTRALRSYARKFCKDLPKQKIQTAQGFFIWVQPSEWIGSHIAFHGEYEPGLARLIEKHLTENSCFLDVGANIGYFSLLGANICRDGKVLAIEAISRNADALESNIALNRFEDRIELHRIAAWSCEEELEFSIPPEGLSGLASVRTLDNETAKCRVPARKLDDLVEESGCRISVMKIDVEGAEREVLLGSTQILLTHRPILFLELSNSYLAQLGSSGAELVSMLQETFSYSLYLYDQHGALRELTEDDISEHHGDYQYNIAAYPIQT